MIYSFWKNLCSCIADMLHNLLGVLKNVFCLCRILGTFKVGVLIVKAKLLCTDKSCLEHIGIKWRCAFPSTAAARAKSSILLDKPWVRTRVAWVSLRQIRWHTQRDIHNSALCWVEYFRCYRWSGKGWLDELKRSENRTRSEKDKGQKNHATWREETQLTLWYTTNSNRDKYSLLFNFNAIKETSMSTRHSIVSKRLAYIHLK